MIIFMTTHIHRSILFSFTSCLFSWLFVVNHVSAQSDRPTPMLALTLFCRAYIFPLASRASFCHTTLHCTSSNFPMLHLYYNLHLICRCSQTASRNSCSTASGNVSNWSYPPEVHPVTSSRLSSAYTFLYAKNTRVARMLFISMVPLCGQLNN